MQRVSDPTQRLPLNNMRDLWIAVASLTDESPGNLDAEFARVLEIHTGVIASLSKVC
jgi:hypothetical protein